MKARAFVGGTFGDCDGLLLSVGGGDWFGGPVSIVMIVAIATNASTPHPTYKHKTQMSFADFLRFHWDVREENLGGASFFVLF